MPIRAFDRSPQSQESQQKTEHIKCTLFEFNSSQVTPLFFNKMTKKTNNSKDTNKTSYVKGTLMLPLLSVLMDEIIDGQA